MIGSATPVIVGALIVVGLLVLLGVVAGLVAWRVARRRWRALRSHALVRAGEAVGAAVSQLGPRAAGAARSRRRPLPTGRLRGDMWHAVEQATQAVRLAEAAGGPVGELPALCRRLHAASGDVDRLFAIAEGLDPRSDEAVEVHRQAAEVLSAAARVRLAATAAASAAAQSRVHSLVVDADVELQSVAAGLSRLDGSRTRT